MADTARRPRAGLVLFNAAMALLVVALLGLGTWQVQRRTWKLDLIARVEANAAAAPVPAPGREAWPRIGPGDAYRHVRLVGHFVEARETLVQAVTALGGGFWVITPLRTDEGAVVLVNRGFVPAERRAAADRAAPPVGRTEVIGLLRLDEPAGAFLRTNDPAADRWYSRDVAAIAQARDLGAVAPFFVDAERPSHVAVGETLPVAGLTVIRFRNDHLVYAITWFTLALMAAGAAFYVNREAHRSRG